MPETDVDSRSATRVALLAFGVILTIALYYRYPNAVADYRADQAHDAFTYITFAKGFLAHQPYPVKKWHPGFPLLVAAALAILGFNFLRLKLLMITVALATVGASVRWFRDAGLVYAAPSLGLLFATNPLFFDYSHRVMTEIPFLFFLVLTFVGLARLEHAGTRQGLVVAGALLTVSASAALLVRGNGLALVPALAAALFSARGPARQMQRRCVAIALALLLSVYSAWTIWGRFHEFQGIANVTYLEEILAADVGQVWDAGGLRPGVERVSASGLAKRVYQNVVWFQLFNIDATLWPDAGRLAEIRSPGIGFGLGLVALLPAVIGSVVMIRFSLPLFVYLFFSFLITIVYPPGGAARYLLPILPALVVAYYLGFERIVGRERAVAVVIFAAFANLFLCGIQADEQSRNPYDGAATADILATIKEDVPRFVSPDDLVITEYNLVVQALADRRAASPPSGFTVELGQGSAYLLEASTRPIELPSHLVREVVTSRGSARLCRLKRNTTQ
jgi:hypothetical protein